MTLDTRCNRLADHVPNGVGGYADGVCDPAGGYSFTDVTKANFGRINILRGHRVIEFVLKYDSQRAVSSGTRHDRAGRVLDRREPSGRAAAQPRLYGGGGGGAEGGGGRGGGPGGRVIRGLRDRARAEGDAGARLPRRCSPGLSRLADLEAGDPAILDREDVPDHAVYQHRSLEIAHSLVDLDDDLAIPAG